MRIDQMQRREFITLLGGAVAWPLSAQSQRPAMPVIGFLGQPNAAASASRVAAYRHALKEVGFIEGENIRIEYRWADNHNERLPARPVELLWH